MAGMVRLQDVFHLAKRPPIDRASDSQMHQLPVLGDVHRRARPLSLRSPPLTLPDAMEAHPSSFDDARTAAERGRLVARVRRLEYFTLAWNGFEAAVALISGMVAGSVALVSFGLDSVIETASAGLLLWRFRADADAERRERSELTARRLVGVCFLLLAGYVAVESGRALWIRALPERSLRSRAVCRRARQRTAPRRHPSGRCRGPVHPRYTNDFCSRSCRVVVLHGVNDCGVRVGQSRDTKYGPDGFERRLDSCGWLVVRSNAAHRPIPTTRLARNR